MSNSMNTITLRKGDSTRSYTTVRDTGMAWDGEGSSYTLAQGREIIANLIKNGWRVLVSE